MTRKMTLRRAIVIALATVALIFGGVTTATPALADDATSQANSCSGPAHGNTTAWATCYGSGYQVRLGYWCKTSWLGDTWRNTFTPWKTVSGTTKIVGECQFEVDGPLRLQFR